MKKLKELVRKNEVEIKAAIGVLGVSFASGVLGYMIGHGDGAKAMFNHLLEVATKAEITS